MSGYEIGLAREEELAKLPRVELAAAELFRGTDLDEGVFEDSTTLDDFRAAAERGHLWVARTETGEPVGFAFVELVGGQPHLDELDVAPAHGRRGVGRALVEAVAEWARGAGYRQLTLTTFRDIPWNAPFYTSAGFRSLDPNTLSPALAELVEEEATRGLDPTRRCVMVRALRD